MNKILYSNNEFYLLQDWPEEPPMQYDPHEMYAQHAWSDYYALIEQSKSNKIKITNPELLPVVTHDKSPYWIEKSPITSPLIKDGDTFAFPDGLKANTYESRYVDDNGKSAVETLAILSKEPSIATPDTIPDFRKLTMDLLSTKQGSGFAYDYSYAMAVKIWNDYCLPLQQRVKELEESLKGEAEKRWLKRHDRDRQEITELRAKIKQLEEKLKL
jgi:hypothetical protein